GEALPDGDRVGYFRDVVTEQVVEAEPSLVAQLHDHHRDEGLGVGADQELVVRPGRAVAVQVRDADPVAPGEPAPAAHRGIETRDPSLALLTESDASKAPGRGVQEWAHGPNLASGAVFDSRRRCERGLRHALLGRIVGVCMKPGMLQLFGVLARSTADVGALHSSTRPRA